MLAAQQAVPRRQSPKGKHMFQSVANFVSSKLDAGWENLYWLMMEMDVMQWGILSSLFVIAGFMALRTRF